MFPGYAATSISCQFGFTDYYGTIAYNRLRTTCRLVRRRQETEALAPRSATSAGNCRRRRIACSWKVRLTVLGPPICARCERGCSRCLSLSFVLPWLANLDSVRVHDHSGLDQPRESRPAAVFSAASGQQTPRIVFRSRCENRWLSITVTFECLLFSRFTFAVRCVLCFSCHRACRVVIITMIAGLFIGKYWILNRENCSRSVLTYI